MQDEPSQAIIAHGIAADRVNGNWAPFSTCLGRERE
jgi:hypothetical protein